MTVVSEELRRALRDRAERRCEYCRLPDSASAKSFEVDHIQPIRHLGKTTLDNLCWCCPTCNRYKGADMASVDPDMDEPTFLFHPRKDLWSVHFKLNGALIVPLTPKGRATVFALRLNDEERVQRRALLQTLGVYPLA